MKKLLIISAVGVIALTGCATNAGHSQQDKADRMQHKHFKGERGERAEHKHRHKHGELAMKYTCNDNATVTAKYNPKAQNSILAIHAPKFGLNHAEITMQNTRSASGMLFVNDTNPNAKYEWHAKGDVGVLDIVTKDNTHTLKCNADFPKHGDKPHEHGKRPHEHDKNPKFKPNANQ